MSSYVKEIPLGLGIAMVAGALAIGFAVQANAPSLYPVEKGADLLQSQGYTQISGGHQKFFSLCGKGEFARGFEAVKDGKLKTPTVCYNILGAHRPLLENK